MKANRTGFYDGFTLSNTGETRFGQSVKIAGKYVAVGSGNRDMLNNGRAYLYTCNWDPQINCTLIWSDVGLPYYTFGSAFLFLFNDTMLLIGQAAFFKSLDVSNSSNIGPLQNVTGGMFGFKRNLKTSFFFLLFQNE